MLLILGLNSQLALMETVSTVILNGIPTLRNYMIWVVVLGAAIIGFINSVIFTTNDGMYWLQLMDKFAANWSVLLIAISECILMAWIYGADSFLDDVQEMIGPRGRLWRNFSGRGCGKLSHLLHYSSIGRNTNRSSIWNLHLSEMGGRIRLRYHYTFCFSHCQFSSGLRTETKLGFGFGYGLIKYLITVPVPVSVF